MNTKPTIEPIFLQALKQHLGQLEQIDKLALQNTWLATGGNSQRLDNIEILLQHCQSYKLAQERRDMAQLSRLRMDIGVYARTLEISSDKIIAILDSSTSDPVATVPPPFSPHIEAVASPKPNPIAPPTPPIATKAKPWYKTKLGCGLITLAIAAGVLIFLAPAILALIHFLPLEDTNATPPTDIYVAPSTYTDEPAETATLDSFYSKERDSMLRERDSMLKRIDSLSQVEEALKKALATPTHPSKSKEHNISMPKEDSTHLEKMKKDILSGIKKIFDEHEKDRHRPMPLRECSCLERIETFIIKLTHTRQEYEILIDLRHNLSKIIYERTPHSQQADSTYHKRIKDEIEKHFKRYQL